jgi:hypothetical protein
LYNPRDSRDAPTHMLSHAFQYAASLGVAQVALFDTLAASHVSCHNATVEDIRHLREDGVEFMSHLRREVSP